uniref:Uncharacterized protein n=1 Tax=Anguilla anguilla TaxID=7936 RepID=A0A0E9U2Q5_ANGAN
MPVDIFKEIYMLPTGATRNVGPYEKDLPLGPSHMF